MNRTVIVPRDWEFWSQLTGCFALTHIGSALMLFADEWQAIVLSLSLLVCSGGALLFLVYRRCTRESRLIVLTDAGLEYPISADLPSRLIPWEDIESAFASNDAAAPLTIVRLGNYDSVLDGLTEEYAARLWRDLLRLRCTTIADAAIDATDPAMIEELAAATIRMNTTVDTLRWAREYFGGEILIRPRLRDRDAGDFATLLMSEKHLRLATRTISSAKSA
jgi:hypothetical protein